MSSGNINFPLSMPFEYNNSPESSEFYPIQAAGFYDAKFLFVLKGELLAAAGGEELSLKAGDVLVICPDTETVGVLSTFAAMANVKSASVKYTPPITPPMAFLCSRPNVSEHFA